MPDKPSTTTPTDAGAAPVATPAPKDRITVPDAPADPALEAMEKAADTVLGTDLDKVADAIRKGTATFIDTALPAATDQVAQRPWRTPRHPIAAPSSLCRHDIGNADVDFTESKKQAERDFHAAGSAWTKARNAYALAITTAEEALHDAVQTEERAYSDDHRTHRVDDPLGRNAQVFMTRRSNVAQALQAFEAARAGATTTLAGALAGVYAAYAAYTIAIAKAEATRTAAAAAAEQAFWVSVDGIRSAIP